MIATIPRRKNPIPIQKSVFETGLVGHDIGLEPRTQVPEGCGVKNPYPMPINSSPERTQTAGFASRDSKLGNSIVPIEGSDIRIGRDVVKAIRSIRKKGPLTMAQLHPWELAWREGRWAESSPALPEVIEFARDLKREDASRVLDLGCGAGRHSVFLAEQGFQVVGLDVSETALKTLDGRARAASLKNVFLVNHEMWKLPFIDGYFDGVVCTNVLHHGKAAEIRQAVHELHRVMKRKALAFIIALSDSDFRKGTGKNLESNTYVFTDGEEKGIIHHFFRREELESFFENFETVSFNERLIPVQTGGNRAHFLVKLRKS